MSIFTDAIQTAMPSAADARERRWIYVPYDRLTDRTGPLHETPPRHAGIVMVESREKALRRPYHKKKLALLLSNERHFALEQATRGVKVIYIYTHENFGSGLLETQTKFNLPELTMMAAAERELRVDLSEAAQRGLRLKEVEDTTWLSTNQDFDSVYQPGAKSFLMDRFYRAMRKKTAILMEHGAPVGGKFSYDEDNRKPYRGEVKPAPRPRFVPDAITSEVIEIVARKFPGHFGSLDSFDLPTTAEDCQQTWQFALTNLLPHFGPWEDAMAVREPDLFHSRVSALLNLSRVLPRQVVDDVAAAHDEGKIPLACAEGFIRQVLGWREFMRHVHRVTDGYRNLNVQYERNRTGGAAPSHLDATLPLPAAYWGSKSGLNCLDTVVDQVLHEGWSHHITRLMVLSNLANLIGVSPRELTDWFWIAYVDAYDWVVESNVLGMGTYGDGGVTATKPYVSGAAYINRMSDYCRTCRFDPKKTTGKDSCPFTALYWNFMERNSAKLSGNQRMAMPYVTLNKKSAQDRRALAERAEQAIAELLSPETL